MMLREHPNGGIGQASARFLLGYQSPHDEYLVVGLGGCGNAYTLSRFDSIGRWHEIAYAGSKKDLLPTHWYQVTLRVRGRRITLDIDGVRVLEQVLNVPLPGGQFGLFAFGDRRIEFTNTAVRMDPTCLF
jgi:hypothetical protein